jgi:glycine/D-amino acid oxidase-like deaminating enzyme
MAAAIAQIRTFHAAIFSSSPSNQNHPMPKHDFLLTGAGIFGITAAIELRKRRYSVGILDAGTIPNPLAASTDISKVVRMEYGTDLLYFDMAEASIEGWHAWNEFFGEKLYHEVGFLLACRQAMEEPNQRFEFASYQNLLKRGYHPQRLQGEAIAERFPAFAAGQYVDGFFNPRAGFAESGKVVEKLTAHARQLGVAVYENQTAAVFEETKGRIHGVRTREGRRFEAGHVVLSAGAYTPWLLPELQPFMRATGHPVFHLRPSQPALFASPNLPVFAADISNSGWYGFPLHPREGLVKIANHGTGLTLNPETGERVVSSEEERRFRQFQQATFPSLSNDPIVFTRRCLYADTLDGHFWIDRHPEKEGLSVATGGSGHALKMAPVLGNLIATVAEGGDGVKWSGRFRWRALAEQTRSQEEARCQ